MIGAAIIGTGDIANTHIEAFQKFGDRCRIVMLVNRFVEKAQAKAEKYQLDCEITSDYQEILDREDIQLVSICLPPALHCEVASKLLLAGKHVLCEKPMAPTLEECDRMLEAQRIGGGVLSIVAQNRFKPDMMKTKAMLERQYLGRPLAVQINSLWWRGSHYYDLYWRGTWEKEGGGCTFSHAVHHLDLMMWFMGEVESIRSFVSNHNHLNSEVEDLSIHMIRFKNQADGIFTCSLLHHGEEQKFIIDSEGGTIELPHKISVSRQRANGYPEPDVERMEELERLYCELDAPKYFGHAGQIEDVLNAIEQGAQPLITGEEGRKTIEFVTAAYQSAFTGQEVRFPMTRDSLFYTREGILEHVVKFHEKTTSVEGFPDIGISVGGSM